MAEQKTPARRDKYLVGAGVFGPKAVNVTQSIQEFGDRQ
jgi:hypothetical protein